MSEFVDRVLSDIPCFQCLEPGTQEAVRTEGTAELAHGQISTITQALVSVPTTGATLLAAASADVERKFVVLQNNGTQTVWIRFGSAASNTGANGEIALAGGNVGGDGQGGVLPVDGYRGAIYAASASGTQSVSVNYADV